MNRNHRTGQNGVPNDAPGQSPLHPSSFILHPFQRASSLITTLLVLVVLSTIVVAFMQSMSIERSVAKSSKNKLQAELAAESGVTDAMNQLRMLFQKYPDSVTAWQILQTNTPGITSPTAGTFFHFRADATTSVGSASLPAARGPADPNPNASPATQVRLCAIPLISGVRWTESTNLGGAFVSGITTTNSVDLNLGNRIGTPPTGVPSTPFRGLWVEILQNASFPKQTNRSLANYNPPIARYAFWTEDNSFRVNLNTAGASDRGTNSLGTNTSEISMAGTFATAGVSSNMAAAVIALRQTLQGGKLLTPSEASYSQGAPSDFYNSVKFLVTDHSAGLNLTRGGAARLNVNDIVSTSNDATTIRNQLDRLKAAITNSNASPNYGQRFYRNNASSPSLNSMDVNAAHVSIYLDKIAANIRDYLDADSQPTIVNTDNSIRIGSKPTVATGFSVSGGGTASGPNDVLAIGKEMVPCLQETAMRFHLIALTKLSSSLANYTFELDYYFCFWNPYNKDIALNDLGPNPFLKIYNQFGLDTGGASPNIPPGRPYSIPLSSFIDGSGQSLVFRANSLTILTTDPNPNDALCHGKANQAFRPNASAIGALQPQQRVFNGQTAKFSSSKPRIASNTTVGSSDGRAGTTSTDYDTHMLIGNDYGIIESFTAMPMPVSLSIHSDAGEISNPNLYFYRGGSLSGNTGSSSPSPGASGDGRSVNEQMSIQRYSSAFAADNTRFLNSDLGNGPNYNPMNSSFGIFNTQYVNPTAWPDFATTNVDTNSAPSVLANTSVVSVGFLGNIYDPARKMPNVTDIRYSRGGGRTFRVGQPEFYDSSSNRFALWDGIQTNASRTWTSWRLADIFCVTNGLKIDGQINPNGAQRDNGAALRAALQGFAFRSSPDGAPTTSGKSLNATQQSALVAAFVSRLQGASTNNANYNNLFWERGEVSELNVFRTGSTLGADMSATLDRGREEIVNRLLELITTKGSVFTVHSIGQALRLDKNGNSIPISTARRAVTFELEPIFDSQLPADDSFDPATQGGTSSGGRFRKPDRYELKVVSAREE